MFFLFIGAVLAVFIFHIFVFHQYNLPWTAKLINKIPGPESSFYFGSTLRFWKMKNEDRLDDFAEMFATHGETFRYWFSGVPVVFVSGLDDCQTILGSRVNSEKGMMYKNLIPWLGRGLLTSSGHKWHIRRKIITPTFHFSILQRYVEVFNRNTGILVERLRKIPDKLSVNLCSFVTCCTLDSICETAMGTSVNAQSGEPNSYVNGVFRMGSIIAERIFSPILFPEANFALSSLGREHNRILKCLHGFTQKVIKDYKSSCDRLPNQVSIDDGQGIYNGKMSFLQLLLEKQKTFSLTDKDVREEVDTFMFEGHDTTSMGITWALFELGYHPEVQEKCYEEMLSIFGSSKESPTYQDLMEMNYLKRVIQETLRLHPSVPIISRKFDCDMQLKDYLIPARTELVLSIYHLHRNPTVFPDPEKFDPDRFLPEVADKRHKFAYVPFSAGLRNCVGQKFAMMELLIILSTFIRNFKITTLDDRNKMKSVPEMTLRPFRQIHWNITARS